MKILDSNAAEQLFKKAQSLATQPHNSWRCIYLNLDKEQRLNAGRQARFVVPTLISLMADVDGYIYLCDDGDIFILFQGPVKPIVTRLSHFEELKPKSLSLWDHPKNGPLTVFDLSRYWQPFFNLCHAKSLQASSAWTA